MLLAARRLFPSNPMPSTKPNIIQPGGALGALALAAIMGSTPTLAYLIPMIRPVRHWPNSIVIRYRQRRLPLAREAEPKISSRIVLFRIITTVQHCLVYKRLRPRADTGHLRQQRRNGTEDRYETQGQAQRR